MKRDQAPVQVQQMETCTTSIKPIPRDRDSEGCGEGVCVHGRHYYYRVGCHIPHDKVVALKWEGNFCGRQHGDTQHVILAWNGTDFTILGTAQEPKKELAKYQGITPAAAIAMCRDERTRLQAELDARPKCKCGSTIILLEREQGRDECHTCFKRRTAPTKTARHS